MHEEDTWRCYAEAFRAAALRWAAADSKRFKEFARKQSSDSHRLSQLEETQMMRVTKIIPKPAPVKDIDVSGGTPQMRAAIEAGMVTLYFSKKGQVTFYLSNRGPECGGLPGDFTPGDQRRIRFDPWSGEALPEFYGEEVR